MIFFEFLFKTTNSLIIVLIASTLVLAEVPEPKSDSLEKVAIASDEIAPDVTVDILELKRTSGDTVTLKFKLQNNSSKAVEINALLSNRGYSNWDIGRVTLLDPPHKKKYLVMTDSEQHCVCSSGNSSDYGLEPGVSRKLWAKFQAPPEDVAKITVDIPGAPPFEDLTITR